MAGLISTFATVAKSLDEGMERVRQGNSEMLLIHANTAYDFMIRTRNRASRRGMGNCSPSAGWDPTAGHDQRLTYAILEVIDEMSPILEPKPNVRLHRRSLSL